MPLITTTPFKASPGFAEFILARSGVTHYYRMSSGTTINSVVTPADTLTANTGTAAVLTNVAALHSGAGGNQASELSADSGRGWNQTAGTNPAGGTGDFAWEFFVNSKAAGAPAGKRVLSLHRLSGFEVDRALLFYEGGGSLRGEVSNSSFTSRLIIDHPGIQNDFTNHHIVFQRDSSVPTLEMWIDGVKSTATVSTTGTGVVNVNNSIFSVAGIASGGGGNGLVGILDEVIIYNRLLTPSEITASAAFLI